MLYSIESNSELFKNRLIKLAPKSNNLLSNFYTVLIGNNGTGKSTLLNEIARKYKKDDTNRPNKVISISSSISDKFPMDETFRRKYKDSQIKYSKLNYVYLGLRSRNNQFSPNAQFMKALEILAENYGTRKHSNGYRYIFDYLNYQPIIKLTYRLSFPSNLSLTESSIAEHISRQPSFYKENYRSLLDRYNIVLSDIVNFLYMHRNNKEGNLIFNFSHKNMNRIVYDNSIYYDQVEKYKMLELLRKIKIVRKMDVKIFKKQGCEVNFKEASSGEIAILSTLFALIPLVVDKSLILIDEPELSLHPYWQAQYIPLLQKILDDVVGCHIIIATHSHLMLSDLPIGSSSIVTFKREGTSIKTEMLSNSTYGWSAENILLNIFELPTSRNYYLTQIVSEALILIKDRDTKTAKFNELKNKLSILLPYIKQDDPFRDIISSIVEVE